MPQAIAPLALPRRALRDRVARQQHLLAKLERDGYRCEVRAARRMLRALLAQVPAAATGTRRAG